MTVQPIAPTVSLLYLTRPELQERGLQPDSLTCEQTKALAEECLSTLGRGADKPLKLESYPDKNGLLLFIHTSPDTSSVWRFFGSDALLDAVTALPGLAELPLYRWKGAFWLVARSEPEAALSEFADRVEDDPLLSARLAEYALPLS